MAGQDIKIYFLRKKGEEDGEGKKMCTKTVSEIYALVSAGEKIKYTNTAISLKDIRDPENKEFFEEAKKEKDKAKELIRQENLSTSSRMKELATMNGFQRRIKNRGFRVPVVAKQTAPTKSVKGGEVSTATKTAQTPTRVETAKTPVKTSNTARDASYIESSKQQSRAEKNDKTADRERER